MGGIQEFLGSLSETQWDSVVRVMQDLQDSASAERLESLRAFLASLTREIDSINRRRDALGQKIENIDAFLRTLDEFVRKNDDNIEVVLFRSILVLWKSQLRSEVAALRPSDKLEKKYDTERKREMLTQVSDLVASMSSRMSSGQASRKAARQEARRT
jgi:ABC-type transporter Mla subunit MlaD